MVCDPETGPAWVRRAAVILDSFRRHIGRDLVERSDDPAEDARRLFDLPQAVLAHDTSPAPLLDWANLAAARAFDATPETLLGRPSADTAPADATADRLALFDVLAHQGFVTGYSGVRVSLTGRRFIIDDVTVFALVDDAGRPAGHAAVIGSTRPVGR
ncbi:MAG: MEKHLA domain-containing protein [Planctomycetia bacterium]